MSREFDRIQNDIENAKGELLDSIDVFNELAGDLIRSNEWKDYVEFQANELRKKLQDIELLLRDFKV